MALVGYARVSSAGQSLDVQLDKLKHCDKIFQEKKSGTTGARPRLNACLEYVREGDTLVISRLDRLARSTLDLCKIADTLERKGVNFQVIDQNIDTSDATGRLLFHMLGAIAQFETEIRAERQIDGIRKAKDRGIQFGRKKALTPEKVAELQEKRKQGTPIKTLMSDYGLGKTAIYRYLDGTRPAEEEDTPREPEQKTLKVKLYLRVENNNKFVRGKKKSRERIEDFLLSQYDMEIPDNDSGYLLTIPYTTDAGLDDTIYDILREAESIADLRNGFTEADVIALDGSDRHW